MNATPNVRAAERNTLSLENRLNNWPKISVVVPIRNEARFIAQTIQYLLDQDYPEDKVEILVAVGDSEDNTAEIVQDIARRDQRVKYFHNPQQWSSSARNIGARNATGDIVTYVDGHTYIDNDQLFKSVAKALDEQDVKVLSRPQFLETPENDHFQRAVALARKSPVGHGLDSTIYTDKDLIVNPTSSGATYKKEVFDTVGYYDENFDACEDVEFNFRVAQAGFQSFTSLSLAVYYYPRDSISRLFQQMKRYGVGRYRLFKKHPSSLGFGTLIPFLFTVGMPLLAILSFVHPAFFYLFLLGAAPYTLMVLAASVAICLKHGWSYFPLLPPIFLTIHTGLGYGFFVELLRTLLGGKPPQR
ncbi:glycosyltransferase [candidate division GN15 bacterium]|nr:glycosyltransferase [candidate division GN15 bacterium]